MVLSDNYLQRISIMFQPASLWHFGIWTLTSPLERGVLPDYTSNVRRKPSISYDINLRSRRPMFFHLRGFQTGSLLRTTFLNRRGHIYSDSHSRSIPNFRPSISHDNGDCFRSVRFELRQVEQSVGVEPTITVLSVRRYNRLRFL